MALYSLFMQVCSSDLPGRDFTLPILCPFGGFAAGHLAELAGYCGLFLLASVISMASAWAIRRHGVAHLKRAALQDRIARHRRKPDRRGRRGPGP